MKNAPFLCTSLSFPLAFCKGSIPESVSLPALRGVCKSYEVVHGISVRQPPRLGVLTKYPKQHLQIPPVSTLAVPWRYPGRTPSKSGVAAGHQCDYLLSLARPLSMDTEA